MKKTWIIVAAALAGCTPPGPNLKSPYVEQFAVPPEDDPRFSQPVSYPKELLNRPPAKPSGGGPQAQRPMGGGMNPGGGGPGF